MNILTFESKEIEFDNLKISDYRARHLIEVLKVQLGQEIQVGQINGGIGRAVVSSVDETNVCLRILDLHKVPRSLNVELLVALPRPQTVKKILELAGCFSVKKVNFVKSARVESSYFNSSILEDENIKKHLLLGLQQGVKTKLPEIEIHKDFNNAIDKLSPKVKVVAHNTNSVKMDKINLNFSETTLFAFGPEGGWIEQELDYFKNKNFIFLNLSSSILRVENAICSAISQFELMQVGAI